MPVFVIAYFVLNKIRPILGKIGLIFAGIVFYIYGGIEVAAVFGISIVINYLMAVIIAKFIHKRYMLAVAISSNVGILLFFKYLDFSIDDLVLPLGISFFTFQQIMYVVNIYNEKVSLKLIDYLTYILCFPKILMGPLVDPKDFLDQINDVDRKKVDWDNIANGLKIFSLGFFMP